MCDQDLTHFFDRPKYISVKIVSEVVIRDTCGTGYGLCTVNGIYSIQKAQETSRIDHQKLRKKLYRQGRAFVVP